MERLKDSLKLNLRELTAVLNEVSEFTDQKLDELAMRFSARQTPK